MELQMSEMSHLNLPERERSRSASPADSLTSSATDISMLPISGRNTHKRDDYGLTSHLVFAIASAALGSSFQHGYNTGVTNIPQLLIQKFINDTYYERFDTLAGEATVTYIFSILVSIFCVGGMAGALMTAFVAERFGRKGGLLLNNVFVVLAAIFMGSSKSAGSYEMLIIGRFFIGFNSGLNAGLAPMYLAEIAPLHLKGAVGTVYQLVITISILVSQVLGLPQILGTEDHWPFLLAMTLVPSIFMLVTLPFCPESPKYILITQGRDVSAQKALTWLRGTIEVHDEMDEMRAEYEAMKLVPKVTLHEMWHNPVLRTPLLISVMVMLAQQFSGINAAIFFSTDIFLSAGLTAEKALNATLGMGSINVVMTIVSLVLIERAGRRTLLLTGLAGMMVMTILLTICLAFQKSAPWLSYVSIICVITFVIMFAIGPGSIPWFLVTELFGQGARPIATSIAVTVNWSANFIVGLGFLPLQNVMGVYTFLIFTALLAMFWMFTYKYVPETKNKTVEEITAIFRQKAYQ
ncbi:solute carrier family 2, facilitated glucose transporter member 1 [Parasteatoda tepidariorum]|uniref:solute carrier family 2, facilitated glucose transporter member 1 n=1 Tax=Parasteatoda tepidariorum TaxID=114398 RepID=UPI00077FC3EC|nr:solute carrier family 2, facilitated glucose transporter member 1 [Parasteatoda tepidariorum]